MKTMEISIYCSQLCNETNTLRLLKTLIADKHKISNLKASVVCLLSFSFVSP